MSCIITMVMCMVKSKKQKIRVVKYYADTCIYCIKFARRDSVFFSNLKNVELELVEVDISVENCQLSLFNLKVVPSYRIFLNDQEVAFLSGPQSSGSLLDILSQYI